MMRSQPDPARGMRESISSSDSESVEDASDDGSISDETSESTSLHGSDLAFVEAVSEFDSSDYDDAGDQTPSEGSSEHWGDDSDHEDEPISTSDGPETSQITSPHFVDDENLAVGFSTLSANETMMRGKAGQSARGGTQALVTEVEVQNT